QHMPGGAVLAAGVHSLQDNQQCVAAICMKQFLQLTDLIAQLQALFAGFLFVQAIMEVWVEVSQPDWCSDFNRLAHKLFGYDGSINAARQSRAKPQPNRSAAVSKTSRSMLIGQGLSSGHRRCCGWC